MVIRKSTSSGALDPNPRFGLPFSHSYYKAAYFLLEEIESRISIPLAEKPYADLLRVLAQSSLLPALFLVRHTIELMLKEVLTLKDIAKEVQKPNARKHHNFQKLWEELRLAASDDFAEEFKENGVTLSTLLERIQQFIVQLHSVDERGTTFRYPEAPEDNRLFPIDIREVRRQLDAMVDFLGELEGAYMAVIDHRNQ